MKKIYYAGLVASAVLLIAVATPQIFGLLSDALNLSSTGSVKTVNISVYWDSACTNSTTIIPWGLIEAGSSKSVDIYLKNEGTATVTVSMTTQNWIPSDAKPPNITISWNREGQTIASGQSLRATLTCSVSSSIPSSITSFEVEIVITGTETT